VSFLRRKRRVAADKRYDDGRMPIPGVDVLGDEDLEALNDLLPWHCFTVDQRGRPFGKPAWAGKRAEPERIPDPRIERFDQRFGLAGKHVLEVGCFEGVHTTALCARAGRVTAIDGRIENVVKTIVRCAFFDQHPSVLACDLEDPQLPAELLKADLCMHVGVLYHLTDPVGHLRQLGEWVGEGLMLDTHVARPDELSGEYEVNGRKYRFRHWNEESSHPFAGMRTHAKWLLLEDLKGVLADSGFTKVELVEERDERNGARVLLFAEKSAG
jgi:SAM-dependent methyltransferase